MNLILHYYLIESHSNKFGALTITGTEAFVKPQNILEWEKLWYHKGELYFNSYIYILYIYGSWVIHSCFHIMLYKFCIYWYKLYYIYFNLSSSYILFYMGLAIVGVSIFSGH